MQTFTGIYTVTNNMMRPCPKNADKTDHHSQGYFPGYHWVYNQHYGIWVCFERKDVPNLWSVMISAVFSLASSSESVWPKCCHTPTVHMPPRQQQQQDVVVTSSQKLGKKNHVVVLSSQNSHPPFLLNITIGRAFAHIWNHSEGV